MEILDEIIHRNIVEIVSAREQYNAWIVIVQNEGKHSIDFIEISRKALFHDMISHVVKVLDKDSRGATFWDIYSKFKQDIDSFMMGQEIRIKDIREFGKNLKHVWDKTHFHVDKKGVFDTRSIWIEANIKRVQLLEIMDFIYDILKHVYLKHFGVPFYYPDYNGEEINKILEIANAQLSKTPG